MAGVSLGGGVSLFTALEHPEMVSKLALVGSGALGREIAMVIRLASLPVVGEVMLGGPLDNVGAMTRKCFYDKSRVPGDVVEELRRTNGLPGAREAALAIIRRYISLWGVRSRHVMTARLEQLVMPTMLFWGADDEIIPVKHAHRAARLIPGAKLHVFERCGHWPQMERAEEFNEVDAGVPGGVSSITPGSGLSGCGFPLSREWRVEVSRGSLGSGLRRNDGFRVDPGRFTACRT